MAMNDRAWDLSTSVLNETQADVRRMQDRGQLILGAGLAAGSLSIPIIASAPDIGFALSTALITFAFCWHMNLNAEAAAIAELRDFTAERINKDLGGTEILRYEDLGRAGRGHPGTLLTGILPVLVLVAFLAAGGLSAFGFVDWKQDTYLLERPWAIALWLSVAVLAGSAFAAAGVAIGDYRETMQRSLWGTYPGYVSTTLPRRVVSLLLRRGNHGYNRETARAHLAAATPTPPTLPGQAPNSPTPPNP